MHNDSKPPQGIMCAADIEAYVASVWAHILGLRDEDIHRDDNFFLLGGDSLGLARVVVELNESYAIDLTLAELFEFSTLKDLCSHVDARRRR